MMKLLAHLLSFWVIASVGYASIPVSGTLLAEQACPAYLSKNQKTNPDQVHLSPNRQYSLVEANRANNPSWFRINVGGNTNPLRWVHKNCGQISSDRSAGNCHMQPGYADAYVLAMSWQPAFCQTYGFEQGKPECHRLNEKSYTATHFALHGLWPNQKACGTHYGYCQTNKRRRHCDYAELTFSAAVADELTKLMPSYAAGSCLERHEWNRHGSCQLLDLDAYFDLASQLTLQFDQSHFSQLVRKYAGGYVSLTQLKQAIQQDFGQPAVAKFYLGCQSGMLVDVWISLPAQPLLSMPLADLIDQAPAIDRHNRCPKEVYISDFTAR